MILLFFLTIELICPKTKKKYTFLETERLILRPFNLDDLHDFSLICADPEVMKYIGNGEPLNIDVVKERIQSWILSYEENGFGLMALLLKENKKLLGFCGLIQQKVDEKFYIELGYRLDRSFWGQGIATEAARVIKNHAFEQLGITEIISIIHVDNLSSKKVALKVGMDLLKTTTFNNVHVDIFYMKSPLIKIINNQ